MCGGQGPWTWFATNIRVRFDTASAEGDNVAEIAGDFFGDLERTGAIAALSAVKIKAPTMPSKILNIAGNYYSHLGDSPPFTRPQPFLAPPSSVIDPGANIVIPAGSVNVDYEGEIAVIIGKRARKVSVDDAPNYILGDLSSQRRQRAAIGKTATTRTCSGGAPRAATPSHPSGRGSRPG